MIGKTTRTLRPDNTATWEAYRRYMGGDDEAGRRLVELLARWWPRLVKSFVRRGWAQAHDAEDAVARLFASLWRRIAAGIA